MLRQDYIFDKAERVLAAGGLVIVPTETFYAIAANPFDEKAVRRIFSIKCRSETKPLPLIAADQNVVDSVLPVKDEIVAKLMERFWPGSLTMLLPVAGFSPMLVGSQGKIGVRVPPWCAARILAARVGGWITATSANLSGRGDPDDVCTIDPEVIEAVDLVMPLGPTRGGKPSTVIDPLPHGFRVVREGAIETSIIRDFYRALGWE
jgi:L-threonylcarbamoyladenylate synthase